MAIIGINSDSGFSDDNTNSASSQRMLDNASYTYTAAANQQVFKVGFFCGTSTGDGAGVEIAVYDVTSGHSGAPKVATGSISSLTPNAENTATITPVALTQGNIYAVAWRTSSATNVSFRSTTDTAAGRQSTLSGASAFASTWTTASTLNNKRAVYAETQTSITSTLTDVDTDESISSGQAAVAYTGTGLSAADSMNVIFASQSAAASSFSATNATSGTFTAPSLTTLFTAGVPFGSVTFTIKQGGSTLGTLAGTLTAETGYTVHNVTDISQAAVQGCLYYNQSPAVAVGDQIIFSDSSGNVTMDSQGFLIFANGVTSCQYRIWDDTDDSWSSAWATFAAGDAPGNIFDWLYAQGSVGSTADRTFAYLKGLGYSGTMNTQLFNWLRGLGYTGELPRMIDRFEKDNTGKY